MEVRIQPQRLGSEARDALYAELRTRSLRREDWRRVSRVSLVLVVLAAAVAALSWMLRFGLSLPPGVFR